MLKRKEKNKPGKGVLRTFFDQISKRFYESSILLLFLSFLGLNVHAQEKVVPLGCNPVLIARSVYSPAISYKKRAVDSIIHGFPLDSFVFFDDFSDNPYQTNKTFWLDDDVYLNNDMAVYPPSIGVATFDGLNKYGEPYQPGSTSTKDNTPGSIADHLTSVPIDLSRLHPKDSVYLSFFYQPQGINFDAPDNSDSFCLEFKPERLWTGTVWDSTAWVRIWSVKGTTLKPFKQVMIYLKPYLIDTSQATDTIANFYYKAFQFRFLNYASLTGNLDNWHLDYVYLAKGRNRKDTAYKDLAIVNPPISISRNYMSIPWLHFISAKSKDSLMFDNTELYGHNLDNSLHILQSGFLIQDAKTNDTLLYNFNVDSRNINGGEILRRKNIGPIGSKFPFAKYNSVGYNDTVLLRTTLLNVIPDNRKNNDYSTRVQEFSNYYAYDDGTAEAGYGVDLGVYLVGRVAYHFHLSKRDTLRGVKIYFNRSKEDVSNKPFNLLVWKNSYNNDPVFKLSTYVPSVNDSFVNDFYIFKFDTSGFVVDSDIYIGWEQHEKYTMNVGLDENYFWLQGDTAPGRANPNIFYYWKNQWNTSTYSGALMIRPIIGSSIPTAIHSTVEPVKNPILIYPNPAKDILYARNLPDNRSSISIMDLNGKEIIHSTLSNETGIPVNNLKDGMYVYRVFDKQGKNIYNGKIIIRN